MDIASIGAAIALSDPTGEGAAAAAAAANAAAGLANTAAGAANSAASAANSAASDANGAKTAANNAASAANQAAANYSGLDKGAVIDRNAFNYAYTLLQAELRDVQKRLLAAEAKLAALTS